VCLGLLALLTVGVISPLLSQAPGQHPGSEIGERPRFTLREIITGRNDSLTRIPGPWVRAATMTAPDSAAMTAYVAAARLSGIEPLEGAVLASQRSQHVMGLYRRAELLLASRRTLEAIRASIPSDTTRARFDRIFQPRGEWVVDLHDAALLWARSRVPGLTWESARRALAGAGWLARGDSASTLESIPRALYGLTVLAVTDSAAFQALRVQLARPDSSSAAAVATLLSGYAEGQRWFADAVGFFLAEPWVPDGNRGRSLGDFVRKDWEGRLSRPDSEMSVPEIRTRLFGYPQAVPYYGVPPALFRRLVRSENQNARDWLDWHGAAALLRALRWLPPGDTSLTLLQTGAETVRVTTVPRQGRESLNGFLEPADAIAIDPGYSPLLALGAVVHEWQHLIFRRRQLQAFAASLGEPGSPILDLPGVQPYLAEGFAEWSAERIMAPLVGRWPLLGLGEIQKRAGLARGNAHDQHSLGYALVRELAAAVSDPVTATKLLLRCAEDPSRIVAEPVLRGRWQKYRQAPDYVFAAPTRRFLIPEVTFTIEDGYPDVIATRILVPPSKGRR
jgi:hypothetical protein